MNIPSNSLIELLMYFKFNEHKYAINCDWLDYNIMLDFATQKPQCPAGYRLEICQGTNVYHSRAMLFDNAGRKELTLLWEPYSSTLNPLKAKVQVHNEFLYIGRIESSLQLVKEIFPKSTFVSIGRFDLCCDFEADNYVIEFIKHLNSGHYYVQGKSEGSAFWHADNRKDYQHKLNHCLSWGSKTTEIKVKLYNKSREQGLLAVLKDKDGNPVEPQPEKPWIISQWVANDMDIKKVWRLEFSIKTSGQMRWNDIPIHLDNIASPSWLMRVFFDMYYSRFVTRINQGKREGHKNKDERVFLIDLPKEGEKLSWAETLEHRSESSPAVLLLRRLMENLENEALLINKPMTETYIQTIRDVILMHNLEDYFERSFKKSSSDFFEEILGNTGSGTHEKAASIEKLIS